MRAVPAAAHKIPIDRLFGGVFEKRAAQAGKFGFADAEIDETVFHVCLHRCGAFGVGVLLQDGEQGGVVHRVFLILGTDGVGPSERVLNWGAGCFLFSSSFHPQRIHNQLKHIRMPAAAGVIEVKRIVSDDVLG